MDEALGIMGVFLLETYNPTIVYWKTKDKEGYHNLLLLCQSQQHYWDNQNPILPQLGHYSVRGPSTQIPLDVQYDSVKELRQKVQRITGFTKCKDSRRRGYVAQSTNNFPLTPLIGSTCVWRVNPLVDG